MNEDTDSAQKMEHESQEAFRLRQSLRAEKEKYALLLQTNAASKQTVQDQQAKIADLEEALAIANGKHGANWGSEPRIIMRTSRHQQ